VRVSASLETCCAVRRSKIFCCDFMVSEVSQQWMTFQFLLDVSVLSTDEWFEREFAEIYTG
jgi:hypothetical protein